MKRYWIYSEIPRVGKGSLKVYHAAYHTKKEAKQACWNWNEFCWGHNSKTREVPRVPRVRQVERI